MRFRLLNNSLQGYNLFAHYLLAVLRMLVIIGSKKTNQAECPHLPIYKKISRKNQKRLKEKYKNILILVA